MRVLMISTDRTLLGQEGIGDAVLRHQAYAKEVEQLDIIVLSRQGGEEKNLSENCRALPAGHVRAKSVVKKLFKAKPYQLVVCQDPFLTGRLGVFAKKKFGAKLIIHFHGDFFDNPYWLNENRRHRVYKKMAEKNIYLADSIRVVSEGIRKKLIERGISDHDLYTISTPVDLEKFKLADISDAIVTKTVLTVGRIVKAKDFPTLIAAAELVSQKLPDFKWQIVGDGPLLEDFKKQTKNQSYIEWLGLKNHSELAGYYQKSMVVAMTSNNESFGKVFLEGAMAKKPAVATDTVGAREIIESGVSGYIVPIGDAKAVAERISYLLNQPKIAQQMGQKAFEIVQQKFGWEKNINAIINMWRQTVGGV